MKVLDSLPISYTASNPHERRDTATLKLHDGFSLFYEGIITSLTYCIPLSMPLGPFH